MRRFTTAPMITTQRLRLRCHSAADLEACAAMWADPRVTEFITGAPSSTQQTWSRLLGYAGHWVLTGFGYWAVEERDGGAFVGELGFADYKRNIDPAIADVPELGWALTPTMQGKGYATEAVRAAVAWGDRHLAERTVCFIDPQNLASIRLAERCGYKECRRTTYNGADIIILSRRAEPR